MYSIYWIENNTRCGPTTVPDMLGRVQRGELTPDTLGWHKGCQGWLPLRELPALADFLAQEEAETEAPAPDLPPIPPAKEPAAAPPQMTDAELAKKLLSLAQPSPGARLLARLIDTALYATLVLALMHLFEMPYHTYLQPGSPLFWLPMPVLEALLLLGWRTTPGKRWMGIYLQPLRGQFRLGELLMRSILVFAMGMGLMLVPLCFITMLISYFSLARRGMTLWDAQAASLPVLRRSISSITIVAALCFLFFSMQLCSQYMMPWLPDILQELHEQSPETADMLKDFFSRIETTR